MHHLPDAHQWYRFANRGYLEFAKRSGFITDIEPIVLQLWSEPLQKFRLAGEGLYEGPRPRDPVDAQRLATYFDPLPFWHAPLEMERTDTDAFPLHAITQRPMVMYHSWDSQNAWLRQILAENALYVNTVDRGRARPRRRRLGVARVAARSACAAGSARWKVSSRRPCGRGTPSASRPGAWGLAHDAPEATTGFLLNHLIAEHLPSARATARAAHATPIRSPARRRGTTCACGS